MIVAELYAIIREMKEAGPRSCWSSRISPQALTLCDRFIAIERGRLVFEGNAKQQPDCDRLLSILAV